MLQCSVALENDISVNSRWGKIRKENHRKTKQAQNQSAKKQIETPMTLLTLS